ncbi:hypothetical protein OGAPHI_002931 [Ogataea philodendri]|uniref:Uncharacterized protein n=1 Tax=Ogataea philodendri TaxID=1378263 RepID=A0A9P8P8K7_9ASCO|nr:uncharacterized protein OGAPHI_002931 [Ogataea philodendri]KAH3667282.1 hypothetical protein OGAPHI_002931 [Ogataea philodendri]
MLKTGFVALFNSSAVFFPLFQGVWYPSQIWSKSQTENSQIMLSSSILQSLTLCILATAGDLLSQLGQVLLVTHAGAHPVLNQLRHAPHSQRNHVSVGVHQVLVHRWTSHNVQVQVLDRAVFLSHLVDDVSHTGVELVVKLWKLCFANWNLVHRLNTKHIVHQLRNSISTNVQEQLRRVVDQVQTVLLKVRNGGIDGFRKNNLAVLLWWNLVRLVLAVVWESTVVGHRVQCIHRWVDVRDQTLQWKSRQSVERRRTVIGWNFARSESNVFGQCLQQQWQHSQIGTKLQWRRRTKVSRNDLLLVKGKNVNQNFVQVVSSIVQGRRQSLLHGPVREVVGQSQLVGRSINVSKVLGGWNCKSHHSHSSLTETGGVQHGGLEIHVWLGDVLVDRHLNDIRLVSWERWERTQIRRSVEEVSVERVHPQSARSPNSQHSFQSNLHGEMVGNLFGELGDVFHSACRPGRVEVGLTGRVSWQVRKSGNVLVVGAGQEHVNSDLRLVTFHSKRLVERVV